MAKKDELNFENGSNLASGEKLKALQAAMDKIEKSFGKGSIMKMGDESVEQVEVIPTGSIGLNVALGVGGYPRGRIIEIYGPESSGKTTLAIHAIAEAQKAGGIAAFIDAEHAFDRFYAAKLGVDVDNLLISQPDNGEQALEIAEQLIRSSAIDIIVVDSVAALTPKAEIEGDMGDNKVGLQARLMSQALRKLTAAVSKTRTTCIFINQLREKIGVMFGNPETTTGGNALKFYASVRLDIRGSQAIKNGDEVIGKQTKVKVVKNKVAPPFRRAEFDIMFGEGISRAGEIIDLGAELGIIKKSGSWFSYNETKIAQGRDAAKQVILDNPELAEELEGLIFAELKNKTFYWQVSLKGYRFLFHLFQTFFQSLHAFFKTFPCIGIHLFFQILVVFQFSYIFQPFQCQFLRMLQFSKPIAVLQLLYLSPVYIRKLYIHIVTIPAGILIHHDILYILQSHITFQINKFQSSCTIYNHNQLLHLFPFTAHVEFRTGDCSLLLHQQFISGRLHQRTKILTHFFLYIIIHCRKYLHRVQLSGHFPNINIFSKQVGIRFYHCLGYVDGRHAFHISILVE